MLLQHRKEEKGMEEKSNMLVNSLLLLSKFLAKKVIFILVKVRAGK